MSDDPSRPAPGNRPSQQHDPPGWWSALGRADLPADGADPVSQIIRGGMTPVSPDEAPTRAWTRWILALAFAGLMLVLGVLMVRTSGLPAVAVIAGGAVVATTIVVRAVRICRRG